MGVGSVSLYQDTLLFHILILELFFPIIVVPVAWQYCSMKCHILPMKFLLIYMYVIFLCVDLINWATNYLILLSRPTLHTLSYYLKGGTYSYNGVAM